MDRGRRSHSRFRSSPGILDSPRPARPGLHVVLIVGDLLQPVDCLAVECFLNGDVRHCRGWRGAMPVLLVRWEPDDVSRPDLLDRATLALPAAEAVGADKGLTQR